MTELKQNIASSVKKTIAQLYPAAVISEEEIFGMLEYPPDDNMGDIAFPCFKLSRTLRAAPPKIAAAIRRMITYCIGVRSPVYAQIT